MTAVTTRFAVLLKVEGELVSKGYAETMQNDALCKPRKWSPSLSISGDLPTSSVLAFQLAGSGHLTNSSAPRWRSLGLSVSSYSSSLTWLALYLAAQLLELELHSCLMELSLDENVFCF